MSERLALSLRILLVAFCGGITLASWVSLGAGIVFVFLLLCIAALFSLGKGVKVSLAALFLLGLTLGVWRYESFISGNNQILETQSSEIRAMVLRTQNGNFESQKLLLRDASGRLFLTYIDTYQSLVLGEYLKVVCSLQSPEKFQDGKMALSLRAQGIDVICLKPQIQEKNPPQGMMGILGKMKSAATRSLEKNLPAPQSALAVGILMGDASFSERTKQTFVATGTTHITAVSGYNVSILAEYFLLCGIALGFWRKQAVLFALAMLVCFVLLVGFPASAVRAGAMGALLLWAMRKGRIVKPWVVLLYAGSAMLAFNPLLLRHDLGFQLSFLAAAGLIFSSEGEIGKKKDLLSLRKNLETTFWAQLLVIPVLIWNFHYFSPISFLANMLILPAIPMAMLLSFLLVCAGLVLPFLATPFAWAAFVPLSYVIVVADKLSKIGWLDIAWERGGVFVWLFYYLLAGLLLWKRQRKITWREFYSLYLRQSS